jgi:Ca-activated chloride channel family protein
VAVVGHASLASQQREGFRFTTGVELINVTATVTDNRGRFVDGLSRDDFRIYEDGAPQEISHFSAERVPVSLGIVLDTSGSMAGEKIRSAQSALDRFLFDLLDPIDEVFLYRFSNYPILVRGWTTDRRDVSSALRRVDPVGGTAMYDTVAEAVPLANRGTHRKKALVIISDGNDTNSVTDPHSLRQLVRETEVLVYAIGIDGESRTAAALRTPPSVPLPMPFPVPGGRGRSPRPRYPRQRTPSRQGDRSVNEAALRELTDDSGGRTEIVRSADDLDPATAGVANELSRQYYMAYPAESHRDGRWHSIEVEVPGSGYRVRARRGYVATR